VIALAKEPKISAENGLPVGLIYLSRGGGYVCDKYGHVKILSMKLHIYSLLI
jgi:hypothetical protein